MKYCCSSCGAKLNFTKEPIRDSHGYVYHYYTCSCTGCGTTIHDNDYLTSVTREYLKRAHDFELAADMIFCMYYGE